MPCGARCLWCDQEGWFCCVGTLSGLRPSSKRDFSSKQKNGTTGLTQNTTQTYHKNNTALRFQCLGFFLVSRLRSCKNNRFLEWESSVAQQRVARTFWLNIQASGRPNATNNAHQCFGGLDRVPTQLAMIHKTRNTTHRPSWISLTWFL